MMSKLPYDLAPLQLGGQAGGGELLGLALVGAQGVHYELVGTVERRLEREDAWVPNVGR